MQKLLTTTLIIAANILFAQSEQKPQITEKKGFVFGVGLGAGALALNTNDSSSIAFATTLPNIKVGWMVNKRLAVLALLPGANYKYKGKGRGFEGLIVAGQYWIKDKWWVLAGTGLTFDAPAFYTVKDPKTASFHTGFPAITLATGYEVWHKGRFALDLQYRLFLGKANLPNNGSREGIAGMFIIGFNWY